MVSTIKLPAEAGTAKLNGAVCTSAIKLKNETARHAMERIRKWRRAMVLSKLASPRPSTCCGSNRFIS